MSGQICERKIEGLSCDCEQCLADQFAQAYARTIPAQPSSSGWRYTMSEPPPKDGMPILMAVRGHHPHRPSADGYYVTVARWSWSPDARLPHDEFPDDGGFLELNNDWGDGWGGNIGDRYWKPLDTFDGLQPSSVATDREVERVARAIRDKLHELDADPPYYADELARVAIAAQVTK